LIPKEKIASSQIDRTKSKHMNDTVMNWWAHQDSARARTRRLVIMMISAVLATTLMIYVVLLTFRLIVHVFLIIHAFVSNSDKGSATSSVLLMPCGGRSVSGVRSGLW
jgi:Flp pilus assembly protein TadB